MTEVLERTDWRVRAKELGIRMYRRTKVDVLADIAAYEVAIKESLEQPSDATVGIEATPQPDITDTLPSATLEVTEVPPTTIEPIPEHPPWENDGSATEVEGLMRRIETLENRLNCVIEAISKSKKVKGI